MKEQKHMIKDWGGDDDDDDEEAPSIMHSSS